MHPRGPAEGAKITSIIILIVIMRRDMCPETVHPRGPAEGAHYHNYHPLFRVFFLQ